MMIISSGTPISVINSICFVLFIQLYELSTTDFIGNDIKHKYRTTDNTAQGDAEYR